MGRFRDVRRRSVVVLCGCDGKGGGATTRSVVLEIQLIGEGAGANGKARGRFDHNAFRNKGSQLCPEDATRAQARDLGTEMTF